MLLEECGSFDERFDSFWLELKKRDVNLLLAVRTREVLQWHFQRWISNGSALVVTVSRNGRMIAYAIFCRYDKPHLRLRRLRLVDFQALDDSRDALLASVQRVLQRCRKDHVHMFETIGFQPNGSTVIQDMAPHARSLPGWLYFYKATDPELAKQLNDPSVWNASWFDGDASL